MVNGYPAGIHTGASWNKTLAYERGKAMGAEAKLKGVNVLLAPSIGALGRTATAGRNWEGFFERSVPVRCHGSPNGDRTPRGCARRRKALYRQRARSQPKGTLLVWSWKRICLFEFG